MIAKIIKTEIEYQKALDRLEVIFDAAPDSKEEEELEILSYFIEKYETETEEPFPNPDPIEAIKFKMDQMGWSQTDLAELLGKNRASEILNRKSGLSLNSIRLIYKNLGVPADILIQPIST